MGVYTSKESQFPTYTYPKDIPVNRDIRLCVQGIYGEDDKGIEALKNLPISKFYPKNNVKFEQEGSLYYHKPPNVRPQNHVAMFHVDWTIAGYDKTLAFKSVATDVFLLPSRQKYLTITFKLGYSIVLIAHYNSNQNERQRQEYIERITNLIRLINVPVYALVATEEDEYSLKDGMWRKLQELFQPIEYSFYVGNSDKDKQFAEKNKIDKYYTTYSFFPNINYDYLSSLSEEKVMVVMVGMPGSGRAKIADKLNSYLYMLRKEDLKNAQKQDLMQDAVRDMLRTDASLVIDAPNPSQREREKYYRLARENNYKVVVVYVLGDGYLRNKQKNLGIPEDKYRNYFRELVVPTQLNTPGELVEIDNIET